MLPVSAWPPGPPGASLSPFGLPRQINVGCFAHGFVIPKGAWIVSTSSNQVVMFFPPVVHANPARSPGTGLLPGSMPQTRPKCSCPPTPWPPPFRKFNDTPLQPPGRRPPNWFGWRFVKAPFSTLVPPVTTGQLVIADGQNVVITGSGFAAITQAYSV
jgi:hypothetical protein